MNELVKLFARPAVWFVVIMAVAAAVFYLGVLHIRSLVDDAANSAKQECDSHWQAVISIDVKAPPTDALPGDAYLIPVGATGNWQDKTGQIAIRDDNGWIYITPQNGHGICLPNGDVYVRVDGQYQSKIAQDVQSGRWQYAEAGGSPNTLTAMLSPRPINLSAGLYVRLKIKTANTGAATLNVNGIGAKPIIYHETGAPLVGGDFTVGDVIDLTYDGASWRLQPTIAYLDGRYSRFTEPPSSNFYVVGPTGNDSNSGLSATPREGFATIQGAINAISDRYLTRSDVNIYVSPGTYNGFNIYSSMIKNWTIVGNVNNPQSVLITARDVAGKNVRGCVCYAGDATIKGMAFRAYYECAAASGGTLRIEDCYFELSPGNSCIGAYKTQVSLFGTNTFTGNGISVFTASQGASLIFGYRDTITHTPVTIRYLTGTVCNQNFAADSSSTITLYPQVCDFTGNLSGRKYNCSLNAVIMTYGSGDAYLPGTLSGILYSGAQIS